MSVSTIADSTRKSGSRLVGDVKFQEVVEKASYITPVPGGVGPMTIAVLMQNMIKGAERAFKAAVGK